MLIDILKNIEAGNIPLPRRGICGNVQYILDRTYDVTKATQDWDYVQNYLFSRWPEFSGDIAYPVPLKLFWVIPVNPKLGFNVMFNGPNKWSGQYGRARKRLLRFIIEELEKREKSL